MKVHEFDDLLVVIKAHAKYPGNHTKAAETLHMHRRTYTDRLREAKRLGITPNTKKDPREAKEAVELERDSQITIRRLRDDNSRLQNELKEAYRDMHEARSIRKAVLGLTAQPLSPGETKLPKRVGKHLPEVAILHWSDFQWGEVVDLDQMGGRNKYDSEIAAWRLTRCHSIAASLLTQHWKSETPPHKLIIILGGDLFSGDIHEELKETNDIPMPRIVKVVVENLVLAINHLLAAVACDIEIYSTPGNHGRLSRKPHFKNYVSTNYDALVADLLEWHYKTIMKEKRVNVFRPESGDALFNVFGWQYLATHGDQIGTDGGKGFIGPVAPVARGLKKVIAEYGALQIHIDCAFIGHYHTRLCTEEGWSNASLVGPSEYSLRKLRARPAPATQNFFTVHPEKSINLERAIFVGHPDEGSLYRRRG